MYKAMTPFLLVLLLSAEPAFAYVGPGSGLGAVGAVLGLIGTLFLAAVSFIWYPIKRALRKMRRRSAARRAVPALERERRA